MDSFDTILFKKQGTKDLATIFQQYDHWEEYNHEKTYPRKFYERRHKNKIRTYINILCCLERDNGSQKHYILSERYRSENHHLIPYCSCSRCNASFLNPIKYLWCECCTGCIKSGDQFTNPILLEKAKEYHKKGRKPFFNGQKIIEAATVVTSVVCLLYSMHLI